MNSMKLIKYYLFETTCFVPKIKYRYTNLRNIKKAKTAKKNLIVWKRSLWVFLPVYRNFCFHFCVFSPPRVFLYTILIFLVKQITRNFYSLWPPCKNFSKFCHSNITLLKRFFFVKMNNKIIFPSDVMWPTYTDTLYMLFT